MSRNTLFLSLLIFSLFLRLILIPNPGFEADVSFWKSWGLATVDFGIVEGLKATNNNYPTPFAYTLGALVWVYTLFADPHNFNEFWKNTNLLFLAISKSLPILADIGIAGLLFVIPGLTRNLSSFSNTGSRIGIRDDKSKWLGSLLAIIYLLNPVSLMDGAWWGQVDSVGVFLFLCSLFLVLRSRFMVAGAIFMLAMMTKLQNMIYGPLFFLFIWQSGGYKALIQSVAGATLGFFGLNIEFVLARNIDRVLASLTENYDYFPWMSLHAHNLWWIVSGGNGMGVSDKITVLGLLNAKTIGLLLFSSFYLFALCRQLVLFAKFKIKTFLESLIIVNAAFFLFQTQSHDRYAFPLIAFLLLWSSFLKHKKIFYIVYAVFSLFYFYNLHTALVVNYPANGLPLLSLLTQPFFTITTAIVLLVLFGIFLVRLRFWYFPLGVTAAGLLFFNIPLRNKQPVSLTKFTPYISEQAYGTRQTNRSVQSSFGGPFMWTRLSVQYLFYDRGIGTHANSKHVFDINKKFKRFTVDFGIDTEAGTRASAVFEIYGDDTLLFRSDTVERFDLPRHADINITGVKHLMLKTVDAGDGNYDDHTDWLNPTLWQ